MDPEGVGNPSNRFIEHQSRLEQLAVQANDESFKVNLEGVGPTAVNWSCEANCGSFMGMRCVQRCADRELAEFAAVGTAATRAGAMKALEAVPARKHCALDPAAPARCERRVSDAALQTLAASVPAPHGHRHAGQLPASPDRADLIRAATAAAKAHPVPAGPGVSSVPSGAAW